MMSVTDERYRVAVTRMGNRLRIAGITEIGARTLTLRDAALGTLLRVARDWFPRAAVYRQARFWVGARPMLPDGPPLLGPTAITDLYLNVGHGASGWANACGAARVVADLVARRTPDIALDGLTLDRYRSRTT
jgi:D-amino-acid dehydrogenase